MTQITKGTEAYAKAQKMANSIQGWAEKTRRYDNTYFNLGIEVLVAFLRKVMALDCFAAQIAKTVDASIDIYGYKVANVSSKQAWILACAAVENNIEL
jgi:hypothetical protein